MKIVDKLVKVDESISIQKYDNGYMFEVSGRNKKEEWTSVRIITSSLDELFVLIKEFSELPKD